MTKPLVTATLDGSVLIIRLNSPDNRNSLTTELRAQLGAAVERAATDRAVRTVYLTAEGQSFCSGGDLKMLQKECDPWTVHRRFRNLNRWLVPLITLDKPVVVGVKGHAVGGGMGLALSGDLMIAGESAKFIAGFFRIGTIPDIGIMFHLPRLIGMARAKNFIFGNETMTAQQALDLGLVAKVVPDEQLEAAGLAEAKRLAEGPAEVMGLAKTLMARSFEVFFSAGSAEFSDAHMPVKTAEQSASAMTRISRSMRPVRCNWLSSRPKPRLLKSETIASMPQRRP